MIFYDTLKNEIVEISQSPMAGPFQGIIVLLSDERGTHYGVTRDLIKRKDFGPYVYIGEL